MMETVQTLPLIAPPAEETAPTLERLWRTWVTTPLHRYLDAGLRAGELGALDAATLTDIGFRRG